MTRPACAVTVLLWLALSSVSPAAPMDMGTPPSMGDIRFAADVVVTPAVEGGVGRVQITYTVSHDDLVFLRTENGYSARYEVTAVLHARDWRQAAGDSWLRRVDVPTYAETNSRAAIVGDTLALEVAPGTYKLRMELRSLDTGAAGVVEREVIVPEYEPGRLVLGSITFERAQAARAEAGVFEPNPSRDYGEEWPVLRVRVPVYGDLGARYRVGLTVETDRGSIEKAGADTVLQTALMTEHTLDMSVLDLDVGVHFLRVSVRALDGGPDAAVRSRFRVLTSPKSWGEDFEKMLVQVSYIASRDEVEKIKDAPEEGRDAAWAEFWKRHDPDPATEENEFRAEFLRRLGYANTHFKSLIEGWQTDMGRTYIQYGEPDETETQPVDKMLHSWEVWYYYEDHLKFTFVDTEGFGEFSLVETSRI
jgi:GWxTD domain-containing protein